MARPTPRRLTMADLAILTAGAGLSMGLLKMSRDTSASTFEVWWPREPDYSLSLVIVSLSLGIASALVAARMNRPRPRWRAMFRQPGTSACLAILGHMLFVVLSYSWHNLGLISYIRKSLRGNFRLDFNAYLSANSGSGAWVLVAWATLALARAWRPEPSWIDRSGRILGVVAILHLIWSAVIG